MDQKPVLQFDRVSKTFDLRLLYKNVNFSVYAKQTMLITGKNGAGKTTLLKMIAGLMPTSSGEVVVNVEKEKIGYLGHQTFIYPHLSAMENLRFWTQAFRGTSINEEEIMQILKKVRLDKFAYDNAGIFSRGMAQRLNIARILLQNPSLLLLDEPSTGLDKESKIFFHHVVQEFQEKNAAILWVSHAPSEDSFFATHEMHIENKQITITAFQEKTKNIGEQNHD